MSDEGEKTCPLCAEEMDLTDQQLKPCKCGYEICIWCWHHIMDMAEKDDTEGRCPACRVAYNKEKIVGMAASCERLVAEMSMEKKLRSQKGKSKTSEGRKQLSSVRVIQRNLVYIVGLPLNLADEDLLQRKEYFAQYGKVLKVSISRTAAGAIQHFANNTCSVYITYAKEEEAVRCIQSVHGFLLEGRPLRACFGTTKYCHAWLRNVPCSNPDCLYLHEIGSQEDSFTKDEIISAYTRSRVQQIMGATNSMQRRSGNVLPPPADDYCNNSSASAKPITKSAPNNSTGSTRISPPNSSSGRSVALPAGALWGTRASSNQPASGSLPSSNGPFKHKPDTCNGPVTFSTALASSNHTPISHSADVKKLGLREDNNSTHEESKLTSETAKQHIGADCLASSSDAPVTSAYHPISTSSKPHSPPATKDKDKLGSLPSTATSGNLSLESGGLASVKDTKDNSDEKNKNSFSEMPSVSIDGYQGLEHGYIDKIREPLTSQTAGTGVASENVLCLSRTKSDSGLDSETRKVQATSIDDKDDVLSFDDQRLKDPEVITDSSYLPKFSHSLHPSNSVRGFPPQLNGSFGGNDNFQIVDNKVDSISQSTSTPVFYSGYPENHINNFASLSNNVEHRYVFSHDEKLKNNGRFECELPKNNGRFVSELTENNGRFESELASVGQNSAADVGESSIISNILSLDLDSWDESLNSLQNLAKLLGETDKQQQSPGASSPWKVQQSNQSRFSFAREEESMNQALDAESSLDYMEQAFRPNSYGHEFTNKTSYLLDKLGSRNGFSLVNAEEPDPYSSHPHFSSSKLPVSRSQVSAPPGFSTPNRAPPPGFTSNERLEQAAINSLSGHHMFETSSLLRNQYQAPQSGNLVSNGDIEFMDPAILAVGKGRLPDGLNSLGLDMRSNFSPQLNAFENDARLQLLMQRSLSSHQNPRFDMGDTFSSITDSFRIPSRVMEQSLANNISPFTQVGLPQSRNALMSNGHWDSWNEVQGGNNMGMAELLRPEKLGFNKFYNGYEDLKLRMSSQGDLYNRAFGI